MEELAFLWIIWSKYYPENDFINAKKGHYPSFAWRSIWQPNLQLELELNDRWVMAKPDFILYYPTTDDSTY